MKLLKYIRFNYLNVFIIGVILSSCNQLEDKIEQIRAESNLPALGIAVVKNGQLVDKIVTGHRSIESTVKTELNDKWHLGSLSKAFTATLAGIIIDQNKIKYDSTIEDIFPDFKGKIEQNYLSITLRELLNQTAGLPQDETRVERWEEFRVDTRPLNIQRRDFVQDFLSLSSSGKRGTHRYANGHYVVAGVMLEEVTGKSYEELVKTEIFEPLKMQYAGFGPPGNVGELIQPKGHLVNNDKINVLEPTIQWDNPKIIGPSGTIHASLDDYSKFLIEHLNAFKDQSRLISKTHHQHIHSAAPNSNYAMGWRVMSTKDLLGSEVTSVVGEEILMHGGSNGYWIAGAFMFPKIDMGVIIVSNMGGKKARNSGLQAIQTVIEDQFEDELSDIFSEMMNRPSISEPLLEFAKNADAEAVIKEYKRLKKTASDQYNFGPGEYMYVGHYYFKIKKLKEAIKLYKHEEEMFPKYGSGYFMVSRCYYRLGDIENAILYYKKSIAKRPEVFQRDDYEKELGLLKDN